MEYYEEEVGEPVSPVGQYLNSSVLSLYVLGVLEIEIPIDDSQALSLLKDVFLPINPRFSSIMVEDENGEKKWKRVDVKLEEHVKVPAFPVNSLSKTYDEYLDEYLSKISVEQLSDKKPLWEIHIVKYPTSNAAGTLIFKLHHALGDGYSLMGALFSCLQRADNPSIPLTFPSTQRVEQTQNKSILRRLPSIFSSLFNTISDFGWSVLKSSVVEDDQSPIRSGDADMKFRNITISSVSFDLNHIREIKSKLGVTINDVITGMIFLGIRLYMQEMKHESKKANSTALVLLNTRNIGEYKSVKEMLNKADAKSKWGNQFSFLHIPIPQLSDSAISNPLEFVWEAQKMIKRKRASFAVHLTGMLLDMVKKFRGPEAGAGYMNSTLKNSSVAISNMIGPVEQMSLANHPIKSVYFMVVGSPMSLIITVMSYMGKLRVAFGMENGLIHPQKFKLFMQNAYEILLKAA